MQKPTYVFLLLITTLLIGYTLYYSFAHQPVATPILSLTASTTEVAASTTELISDTKNILTTKSGKTITILETNPNGQSLSTILITPEGFATNTPVTLETNKLTKFFLADLNKDNYDELVLITTSQGSGSYGEAIIYTTTQDQGLILVSIPQLKEEDTIKGALFEGYMGHDAFSLTNDGLLVREFPTYTASDTDSNPTGSTKKIIYSFNSTSTSTPTITFTKETQTATTTTSQTASSSKSN